MLPGDHSRGAAGRRPAHGRGGGSGRDRDRRQAPSGRRPGPTLRTGGTAGGGTVGCKPGPWSRTVTASHRPGGGDVQVDAAVGRVGGVLDRIIHQVREDLIDHGEINSYARLRVNRADDEFHAGLAGAHDRAEGPGGRVTRRARQSRGRRQHGRAPAWRKRERFRPDGRAGRPRRGES